MSFIKASRVPVGVWLGAFGGFFIIVIIAFNLSDITIKNYLSVKDFWLADRLNRISSNGLIVIGSSLTRAALPYDEDFEALAKKKGLSLEFVRFSKNSGEPEEYVGLIDEISRFKPRWVFLHGETFFTRRVEKNIMFELVLEQCENVHLLLLWLVNKPLRVSQRDDETLMIAKSAAMREVIKNKIEFQVRPPVFPEPIESFIDEAKARDIRVVLLETNRSQAANKLLGPAFTSRLDETLRLVSRRYKIPLWRFRGDLTLDYYVDRAHLNREGRRVFSDWFLSELAKEY